MFISFSIKETLPSYPCFTFPFSSTNLVNSFLKLWTELICDNSASLFLSISALYSSSFFLDSSCASANFFASFCAFISSDVKYASAIDKTVIAEVTPIIPTGEANTVKILVNIWAFPDAFRKLSVEVFPTNPIACDKVPTAFAPFPIVSPSFDTIFIAGPIAATKAAVFIIFSVSSSVNPSILSINPSTLSKNLFTVGVNLFPMFVAILFILFVVIFNLLSNVWYLLFASFVNATFSFQAFVPVFKALLNKSPAFAALNKESLSLTSVNPISDSIVIALSPLSCAWPNPFINSDRAPAASSFHAFLNCSAVIPDTAAKSSKFVPAVISCFTSVLVIPILWHKSLKSLELLADNNSKSLKDIPVFFNTLFNLFPLCSTAFCIFTIAFDIAEPPISASIPTELNAVASPKICPSDIPIWWPAPASLIAIFTISASVVAKLFPKSTIDEPNLSKSFCDICVIFANLASCDAASSAVKFVEFPKSIIAFEKLNILSVCIPNCPAASATAEISVVLDGISSAISFIPCFKFAICCFVPSTVFSTPVKAVSNSFAELTAPVATAAIGNVSFVVIVVPILSILLDIFDTFLPNSSILLPAWVQLDASAFSVFNLFSVLTISLCRLL